jgi:hypothetical protein
MIVGGTLSFMVMTRDTEASVLPHASVAVHVSVTFPLQLPATVVVKDEKAEVPVIEHVPFSPLLKPI